MSVNTEAVHQEPQTSTPNTLRDIVRRHPVAFGLGGIGLLLVLAIVALIVVELRQPNMNSPAQRAVELSPTPSSCRGGSLSRKCAQWTLARWIGQKGSVTVNGVQDAPQQNAAVAQIILSNFQYSTTMGERTYSGAGTATFVHYNDGRWVLNRVDFGGIGGAWITNINMEVR